MGRSRGLRPPLRRDSLDRHEGSMRTRSFVVPLALLCGLFACRPRDRTITRGADGENDWARILSAALPLGTSADSSQALMERNGFQCQADTLLVLCNKGSTGTTIARRHWEAAITLDHGRVAQLRSTTGLTGP